MKFLFFDRSTSCTMNFSLGVVISCILATAIKYSYDRYFCYIDPMSNLNSYGDHSEALYSGANDLIVVKQEEGHLKSSPLHVMVGKLENWETLSHSRQNKKAEIHVNGQKIDEISVELGESGIAYLEGSEKTCKFTESQLELMKLNYGQNQALLVIHDLDVRIPFSIFLYDQSTKVILTDIDGTITKSDFRGFVGGHLGMDVHHEGVIELLHKVAQNGYVVIYLTARPIALDLETRKYLFEDLINNDDEGSSYRLPQHPLFLTPAVMSEAAFSGAQDHIRAKTVTLQNLMNLFKHKSSIVSGAYGNKDSDIEAYRNIAIPDEKIFIINKQSQMVNIGTKQDTSYKKQAADVDNMYPNT